MDDTSTSNGSVPTSESEERVLRLIQSGWEREYAQALAHFVLLTDIPGKLFSPAEFSFDTASDKIGILYSTEYLAPTTSVLESVASSLAAICSNDIPFDLPTFLAEAYEGRERQQMVRFGCAVRDDSRTAYFEGIPLTSLRQFLKRLGTESLYTFAESVASKLGPQSAPEGIGIKMTGAKAGRSKLFIPVRNSNASKFHSCLSDLGGRGWGEKVQDLLHLWVGHRNIYQSGRTIITVTQEDPRPGIEIYLQDLMPSDACTLLLAHLAGIVLGARTEFLTRFANEFSTSFRWTESSVIAFMSFEPGGGSSPRMRIWLRPAKFKAHPINRAKEHLYTSAPNTFVVGQEKESTGVNHSEHDRLETSVAKALRFLYDRQLPTGEFRILASNKRELSPNYFVDSSPYTTTFVVYALGFVENRLATEMIDRAFSFLENEMDDDGMWRYWTSQTSKVIDPDSDVTACASFILRKLGKRPMYALNADTILANRSPEGLFYTWLSQSGGPNDIDSIVNANVLLYLGEAPVTLTVCDYLNDLVLNDKEEGSYYYYLDNSFLYYAMSRAYFQNASSLKLSRDAVLRKLMKTQQSDGSFGNALSTGLAACTLLNFAANRESALDQAVNWLVENQSADGSWPRTAAWAGPPPPGPHSVWWGSEELTTAICLEALARYEYAA
jgi:hypothetical protein